MKHLSITAMLLSIACQLLTAAPATPITRGRLTTDLDAAGHSITNSPMATTNFVWEVVGTMTNNLPSGGLTTNDVRAIVGAETEDVVRLDGTGIILEGGITLGGGIVANRLTTEVDDGVARIFGGEWRYVRGDDYGPGSEIAVKGDIPSTNLPPLSVDATVGDLVDAVNAVIGALRKEDEE